MGKVVLDVGTGTGILAMFAAKAGWSMIFSQFFFWWCVSGVWCYIMGVCICSTTAEVVLDVGTQGGVLAIVATVKC